MILYTTVPQELIFPTDIAAYGKQEIITFNGIPMMVEKVEDGKRIIRILSTDPADYLENSIMPGQIILG